MTLIFLGSFMVLHIGAFISGPSQKLFKCFNCSKCYFFQVPCPRHRLPKYDPHTDKVGISCALFKKSEVKTIGIFSLNIFKLFRLIQMVKVFLRL